MTYIELDRGLVGNALMQAFHTHVSHLFANYCASLAGPAPVAAREHFGAGMRLAVQAYDDALSCNWAQEPKPANASQRAAGIPLSDSAQ